MLDEAERGRIALKILQLLFAQGRLPRDPNTLKKRTQKLSEQLNIPYDILYEEVLLPIALRAAEQGG